MLPIESVAISDDDCDSRYTLLALVNCRRSISFPATAGPSRIALTPHHPVTQSAPSRRPHRPSARTPNTPAPPPPACPPLRRPVHSSHAASPLRQGNCSRAACCPESMFPPCTRPRLMLTRQVASLRRTQGPAPKHKGLNRQPQASRLPRWRFRSCSHAYHTRHPHPHSAYPGPAHLAHPQDPEVAASGHRCLQAGRR